MHSCNSQVEGAHFHGAVSITQPDPSEKFHSKKETGSLVRVADRYFITCMMLISTGAVLRCPRQYLYCHASEPYSRHLARVVVIYQIVAVSFPELIVKHYSYGVGWRTKLHAVKSFSLYCHGVFIIRQDNRSIRTYFRKSKVASREIHLRPKANLYFVGTYVGQYMYRAYSQGGSS
jgi:hypothetical protein